MKLTLYLLLAIILGTLAASGQEWGRKTINIPDIPGYVTLKCDFHVHTVFSDGKVWPDIRVQEAWEEGLDAIAITEHIEYRPYKGTVIGDHNPSYEVAKKAANKFNLMVIAGAEITWDMPPGHLNAIFLTDANKIDVPEYINACGEAKKQGAFIFWNHPGWKQQLPDGQEWFPEHTQLVTNGLINGIEIVNDGEYYPEAFRWCLDQKLTMLGNSDIHGSTYQHYNIRGGEHRPITLVFARSRKVESIKEALFAGRTAVLFNNAIYGQEKYLKPLYAKSVRTMTDKTFSLIYSSTFNL